MAGRSSGGRAASGLLLMSLWMSLAAGLAGCGLWFSARKVQTCRGDDSKSRGVGADAGHWAAAVTGPRPEQNSSIGEIRANQHLDSHQGTCPIILHETSRASLKGVRMRSALSNLGTSRKQCPFPSGAPSGGMERGAAPDASTTMNRPLSPPIPLVSSGGQRIQLQAWQTDELGARCRRPLQDSAPTWASGCVCP